MGGLKQFLLRGNVVDLAVGVMIGGAFGAVINALVRDLLTPLIAAVAAQPDFSAFSFTINNAQFLYGDFLNTLISFLVVAAAIYYLIVLPINALMAKTQPQPPPRPATKKCPECLSEVPATARRCAHCTSVMG